MSRQQAANEQRRKQAQELWQNRKTEIEWLYCSQQWSQQKVAEYFRVTTSAIQKVMKRLGIKARTRANVGKRNGRYKDGKSSRLYRVMITKDECQKCKTTKGLGIHHKNDDHYDNRTENLEVLCNSCHMSETKRKWWAAKKAGLPTPKSNGPVGWSRQMAT